VLSIRNGSLDSYEDPKATERYELSRGNQRRLDFDLIDSGLLRSSTDRCHDSRISISASAPRGSCESSVA
jgi:hypothetical protein